jgi:hypothetical protein
MSFILETYQCYTCMKYFNVALGTFGGGFPKECPFCHIDFKIGQMIHVGSGIGANNDGSFRKPREEPFEED